MKTLARAIAAAGFCLAALPNVATAMSSTSTPSNWRFDSTMLFNGYSFNGVARLMFDTDGNLNNGAYVCSGTLLAGGQYVLTAAHCADDFNVMRIDFGINNNMPTVTRGVDQAFVHAGWNGNLYAGADIAILKLDQAVNSISGFNLANSLTFSDVLMMGYGTTGTGDSVVQPGWNDWGYGHWGMNTFEYTWAGSTYGAIYAADFDDGTDAHNSFTSYFNAPSSNGLGSNEALISGGDSGGGDFYWSGSEWLLTGIHSFGAWTCSTYSDFSCTNTSSYGDFMGSTAVYSHLGWINSIVSRNSVPEPGSMALIGLGLAGIAGIRRRKAQQFH